MGEIDHFLADPAIQAGIEALRSAEARWAASEDKDPDPQMYSAVCAIVGFAKAGGNVQKVLNLVDAMSRQNRRERGHLTAVET